MNLNKLERSVYDYCASPITTKELAEKLEVPQKTMQWVVAKLRRKGYLVMEKYKPPKSKTHTFRYTQAVVEVPVEKKPYEPIGMCIFGVWM